MNNKKEELKNTIRNNLKKRIILFGVGIVAIEFYKKYKDKLNISHCVSNYKREWGKNAFLNTLDVVEYKKENIGKDDYIIVCGPYAFNAIELQLQMDGFKAYSNFIESGMASVMCSNKKVALFYGNCILRDIYILLQDYKPFADEYVSTFSQLVRRQAVVANRVLMYMKDICDLYIYSQKILDRDAIFSLKREELPDDCQCISVSNISLPLYWPQSASDPDEHNPYYLHSIGLKRDLQFYHTIFRNEDYGISRLVLDGYSTNDVVKILSSDDYYTEKQVVRNKDYSMKLTQMAEKGTDIGILDYVQENYQKELLYQNSKHPSKPILWNYIYKLMNKIGVSLDEYEVYKSRAPLTVHDGGDVPIYPSVAKYLRLEFIDEDTKYNILTEEGSFSMVFPEYVEYVADYTRKTLELMKLWE